MCVLVGTLFGQSLCHWFSQQGGHQQAVEGAGPGAITAAGAGGAGRGGNTQDQHLVGHSNILPVMEVE